MISVILVIYCPVISDLQLMLSESSREIQRRWIVFMMLS